MILAIHHIMKDNKLLNQITVVDDFFKVNDLNKIRLKLQEPKWSFVGGGVDDIDQSITSKFWHMENLDEYFSKYLFKKIVEHFKFSGKLIRTYANGQTACQSGVPHRDDGDLTFLLFTEKWKHHWGGNLFFSTNDEIIKVMLSTPLILNITSFKNCLITFSNMITYLFNLYILIMQKLLTRYQVCSIHIKYHRSF